MSLKLMYITNQASVAQIAEKAGVDRIFVDMEFVGKSKRQGGMDTVQSHHTVEDVKRIKEAISTADVMVRINPIHDELEDYMSSATEIDAVIKAGADIIMLPYFKTLEEVTTFIKYVDGRVKTLLLIETPEAAEVIDEILKLDGVDEIFVGLNDLSLGYGKVFMFEVLADGTVECICRKCEDAKIPYGFGGIAALGKGDLPAEYIIKEHYRLGSTCVILSRSFCDVAKMSNEDEIRDIFNAGIRQIREFEQSCLGKDTDFEDNRKELIRRVEIVKNKKLNQM